MPKITVIMPALNVIKYIKPCLDSVCGQTLQDMEILFIDAGSTDGTLEFVLDYARQDSRIRIIHSDRKSYGYQINLGITAAVGEYVAVVETDDIIVQDMMEVLYREAIRSSADYVKGTADALMDISEQIRLRVPTTAGFKDYDLYGKFVVVPCEMPKILIIDYYYWTGIYKNQFIKKIILNESPGAAYQDTSFMFQAYSQAKKAVYLPKPVYLYRHDNMNASTYDRKGFRYFIGEYDYISKFLPGLPEEWHAVYYERMLKHCIRRFLMMGVSGEFWEEMLPEMRELRSRLHFAYQEGFLKKNSMTKEEWDNLQMYLKSPETIYSYYSDIYKPRRENIREMFSCIGQKKVVIFGSGNWGKFVHALIENKLPGQTVAFCDNNKGLWETEIQGIPVISPEESVTKYPEAIYIIAGKRFKEEMHRQLIDISIGEDSIFIYTAGVGMLLFQI